MPPAKDCGPRGPAERRGPFETAPGSRARLPDSLEAMTRARPRPASADRAPLQDHGRRYVPHQPGTKYQAPGARDLREIRTLIRTLLDARSLVATASAVRHGGPTVRHEGIQHTRPGVNRRSPILGIAQDIPPTSVRTRPPRWRRLACCGRPPDGMSPTSQAPGRRPATHKLDGTQQMLRQTVQYGERRHSEHHPRARVPSSPLSAPPALWFRARAGWQSAPLCG